MEKVVIKETREYRVETEDDAVNLINECRKQASEMNHEIAEAKSTHKEKKKNKEVVDECWLVKITEVFNSIWEEEY